MQCQRTKDERHSKVVSEYFSEHKILGGLAKDVHMRF